MTCYYNEQILYYDDLGVIIIIIRCHGCYGDDDDCKLKIQNYILGRLGPAQYDTMYLYVYIKALCMYI
jgi:hypothetical protein